MIFFLKLRWSWCWRTRLVTTERTWFKWLSGCCYDENKSLKAVLVSKLYDDDSTSYLLSMSTAISGTDFVYRKHWSRYKSNLNNLCIRIIVQSGHTEKKGMIYKERERDREGEINKERRKRQIIKAIVKDKEREKYE